MALSRTMRGASGAALALLAGCAMRLPVRPLPAPSGGAPPAFMTPDDVCGPSASGRLAAGAWRETLDFVPLYGQSPRHMAWGALRTIVVGPGQQATVTVETDGFGAGGASLSDRVGGNLRFGPASAPTGAPRTSALVAPPGTWLVTVAGAQNRTASLSIVLSGPDVPWAADCAHREGVTVSLTDALRASLFESEWTSFSQGRPVDSSQRLVADAVTVGDGGSLLVEVRRGPPLFNRARASVLIDPAGRAHPLSVAVPARPGSVWAVVTEGGTVAAYGARSVHPADAAAVLARLDTASVLAAPVTLPSP